MLSLVSVEILQVLAFCSDHAKSTHFLLHSNSNQRMLISAHDRGVFGHNSCRLWRCPGQVTQKMCGTAKEGVCVLGSKTRLKLFKELSHLKLSNSFLRWSCSFFCNYFWRLPPNLGQGNWEAAWSFSHLAVFAVLAAAQFFSTVSIVSCERLRLWLWVLVQRSWVTSSQLSNFFLRFEENFRTGIRVCCCQFAFWELRLRLLNRAAARCAMSWPSVEAVAVQRSLPQVGVNS